MSRLAHGLLLASIVLGLSAGASAVRADSMDPTVHRLGISGPDDSTPCSTDGVNLRAPQCYADNPTYQRLVAQLGTAVASAGLSPARTIGYRHFYIGLEIAVTRIGGSVGDNSGHVATDDPTENAAYREDNFFRLGTQGSSNPASASERYEHGNRFASDSLTWTRLAFRKGLPLGLELGGSAGTVLDTRLWAFTFEVKWALFEGFNRRWPAVFPDLSVGASVTTLTGIRGFTLTVPTFNVRLSKSFVIGDSVTITPYVAGQAVWILADSEVVDVTPGNLSDNAGDESVVVFDRIRAWHPRILAGLQVQYTRFMLNGAFRYDLLDTYSLDAVGSMPKQWTVDIGVGVVY